MNHNSAPEPQIDISALLQGWKTVFVTTVVAMATGVALLMSITPHQEVSAKLIVEPREVALDGRVGTASRDKEFLPTQSEIFQSPAVIEEAIRRLNSGISDEMLTSRLINITKNLKVDPLAGTSILMIRYTDVNSRDAADVLNALIASYSDYLARTEKRQHHELMIALTERDTELRDTLSKLQSEFEQLKEGQTVSVGADSVTMSRILAGLEEALATTQSRLLMLERAATRISPQGRNLLTMATGAVRDAELSLSQEQVSASLVMNELAALSAETWTGLPSPTAAEDRLRLARTRVEELSQKLGPNHPELQAAKANVSSAEAELQGIVQAAPTILRQALESTRQQETSLQTRYDAHLRMNHQNEVARLKESQKLADIERAQQAYETVNAQLLQWQMADQALAAGRAGIAVSVLEPPTPGERAFVANPVIVMGIAGLLGLLSGVILLIAKPQIRLLWTQRSGQLQSGRLSPSI